MPTAQEERIDSLLRQYDQLKKRTRALERKAMWRLVAKFRELDPNLPNSPEALHLGHNWIICGRDRKKSRTALYFRTKYHDYCKVLNDLEKRYWHKIYRRTIDGLD